MTRDDLIGAMASAAISTVPQAAAWQQHFALGTMLACGTLPK